MGRKSVPFADEASMLKMRIRDALEAGQLELSLIGDEESAEDDAWETPDAEPPAAGALTMADLERANRNRARLVGLMHTHRACQGAPIIVVTSSTDEAERERLHVGAGTAWIVKPLDRSRLTLPALRLVH